jgi:hypothetical protein
MMRRVIFEVGYQRFGEFHAFIFAQKVEAAWSFEKIVPNVTTQKTTT